MFGVTGVIGFLIVNSAIEFNQENLEKEIQNSPENMNKPTKVVTNPIDKSTVADMPSKYEGLTSVQIRNVKIIEDSCKLKTDEVELLHGETTANIYAQKCEGSVTKMIDGYKNKNKP